MTGLLVRVDDPARGVRAELEVRAGTVTAVLGPNGAGKSTLLGAVAGLHRPAGVFVQVGGRVLADSARGVAVPPHRRGVALLAQQALLFPHLTVLENVAFAPRSAGVPRRAAREAAARWLAEVDAVDLAGRRPAQLSGGQAQRVAVARALAAEPGLLLLDEPLAALDVAAAPALRSLLRRVLRAGGRTAVLVTHDPLDALALADRVAVLDGGRIVEEGTARQVLARPRSAFAAQVAGVNLLAGVGLGQGGLRTGAGQVAHGVAEAPLAAGEAAVAVFPPAAVAVHTTPPGGSPRNCFPVEVAGVERRGGLVRLRGGDDGGGPGLLADITAAAAAELDVQPGDRVFFVVKATETAIYPAG